MTRSSERSYPPTESMWYRFWTYLIGIGAWYFPAVFSRGNVDISHPKQALERGDADPFAGTSLPTIQDPELAARILEQYGWDFPVDDEPLRPDLYQPSPFGDGDEFPDPADLKLDAPHLSEDMLAYFNDEYGLGFPVEAVGTDGLDSSDADDSTPTPPHR